jgi:hypothetical protein
MKTILKNSLFAITALVILLTSGCKKDGEDEIIPNTVIAGNWKLGANSYKVAYTSKGTTSGGGSTGVIAIFADAILTSPTVNTLNLTFKTTPTVSGTYQLVGIGASTTDKHVELFAGNSTTVYAYIGAAVNIEVTVTGGKVKVVIPEVLVKATTGSSDVKLSATVQEL